MKNLFGKTLVVLIFMFSLMLLAMSGAIYMTHTNWRAKTEKVTEQVQEATAVLEGSASSMGLRKQDKVLKASIEDEENLRNQVVVALAAEVNERKAENDQYLVEVKKQEKDIRDQSITMLKYTLVMLKARIQADNTLIQVQNERNARIRTVHEYVKNMNQIEDLNQQILALEKRARSLVFNQQQDQQ
ncbi:MAG: hypothetical protein Q4C70_02665 [Planctomycetia bacterium]|nr:hypothetical protein [Planctomycetia bacterium]